MQIAKRSELKWEEMSPAQRTGIIIPGMIQIALLVAALWDLRHRPAEEVRGDKRLWVGLSFINFVGPISYFIFGRKR